MNGISKIALALVAVAVIVGVGGFYVLTHPGDPVIYYEITIDEGTITMDFHPTVDQLKDGTRAEIRLMGDGVEKLLHLYPTGHISGEVGDGFQLISVTCPGYKMVEGIPPL